MRSRVEKATRRGRMRVVPFAVATICGALSGAGALVPAALVEAQLKDCDYDGSVTVAKIQEPAAASSWAPDGRRIAFENPLTGRIYLMDPDGTNVVCVTCDPGDDLKSSENVDVSDGNDQMPRWFPDGSRLLYLSDRDHLTHTRNGGGGPGPELYLALPDGSDRRRVTTSPEGAVNFHQYLAHRFHFLPDGRRALRLFWTYRDGPADLWRLTLADLAEDQGGFQIENRLELTEDTAWYESHGFSFDDRKIIYTSTETSMLNGEIYVRDLLFDASDRIVGAGPAVRLTENPTWDEHAHFSPGGERISFISSRDHPSLGNLLLEAQYLAGAPSAADFLLVGPGFIASFQPSTPVKVFPMRTELYLMKPDGRDVRRLTYFGDEVIADNDWSPDGSRIVVHKGRSNYLVAFECGDGS